MARYIYRMNCSSIHCVRVQNYHTDTYDPDVFCPCGKRMFIARTVDTYSEAEKREAARRQKKVEEESFTM